MHISLNFLLLIIGFVMLIKGADYLVEGASSLAKKMSVSELVIGLTIISFGTSAPELIINIISAFDKSEGLVFGNVVGSNMFNILLVLGTTGVISPFFVGRGTTWREIPFGLLVSLILFIMVNDRFFNNGSTPLLSRGEGLVLLSFFLLFLAYVFAISNENFQPEANIKLLPLWQVILYIVGGLVGLLIGGEMVVSHAVTIAEKFGVSEKLIGLTIIAAGTSLPELATGVMAAIRKKPDIAIGNVVGSNIFNILLILGTSATIHPTFYDMSLNEDMYVMLAASLLLFIFLFTGKKHSLNRLESAIFLILFVGYMGYIIHRG